MKNYQVNEIYLFEKKNKAAVEIKQDKTEDMSISEIN